MPVQVTGILYVMTLLVYVSAMLGDSDQPIEHHPQHVVQQQVLHYGLPVILSETVILAGVSFIAMAQDRRITLQRLEQASAPGRIVQKS